MYDPELTNYLTMIATVGLATFWAVCYMYGVCSDKVKPLEFSDKFELGYIDDDEPVVVINQPDPPKKKKKELQTIEDLNKRLNDIEKKNRRLEAKYYRETTTPKEKSKPSPKPSSPKPSSPKPTPKPEVDEQLMRDCSDALIGFGEGKRKAKQASAEILENHPEIKTIEEFIRRVFKR